jgi:carbon-monoxide dehydrogenase medium subunit
MQTAQFDYQRPATLEEAFSLLGAEDARPLAGGHSLLPAMKLRVSNPATLVDISRIPGLGGIEEDGDALTIGALVTHEAVAASAAVAARCPVLAETAALWAAHLLMQIRPPITPRRCSPWERR